MQQSERDISQVSRLLSFSRQLVAVNASRLEIPTDFAKTHGSRLCRSVQLQGELDASPTHDVQLNCYVDQGSYARAAVCMEGAAWEGFVRDSRQWVGQELVFTLTGDSSFTVREEIFWNPPTGFKKRTPLCFL